MPRLTINKIELCNTIVRKLERERKEGVNKEKIRIRNIKPIRAAGTLLNKVFIMD